MSRYLPQLINQTGLKISSQPSTPALSSQSTLASAAPVISAASLTQQEVQSESEPLTPNLSEVEACAPPPARKNSLTANRRTTTEEESEERTIAPTRLGPSRGPTVKGSPPPRDSRESKLLSLVEKETHASPVAPRPTLVSRPSGSPTSTSETAVPIPRAGATLQKVRAWVAVASSAPEPPSPASISTARDATQPATRTVRPETAETRDVEGKSASKMTSSSSRVSLPGVAVRPQPEGSASAPAEVEENLWSVNIGAIHLDIEAERGGKTGLRPAASRPAPSTPSPRANSSRLWRYYLRPF
jgi:hypothetical protein